MDVCSLSYCWHRVLVSFFAIFSVSDILIDDPIRVGRPPYRTSHNYRPWRYEKGDRLSTGAFPTFPGEWREKRLLIG